MEQEIIEIILEHITSQIGVFKPVVTFLVLLLMISKSLKGTQLQKLIAFVEAIWI